MNWVFFLLILVAYGTAVWQQWHWVANGTEVSPMHSLTEQLLHGANDAVVLVIGLIGVLALFLGLIKIAEDGGLLQQLAKLIYPLLKPLFPEIPPNHPAFGAMMMNLSANMIGVGNAATPFGLKAMQELAKLNTHPGVASNAMVLFLAMNTSSLTLLPTKIIALRSSAGSHDPAAIISTTLFATICSTIIAIMAAKFLQRFFKTPTHKVSTTQLAIDASHPHIEHYPAWASILFITFLLLLIPLTIYFGKTLSAWIIPSIIVGILTFGMIKKIDIYTSFTEGTKGGFEIAIKIIPFLVAMLVALAMFRASGAMDAMIHTLAPFTTPLGLPPESLSMVFMRPLSGSASLGILSDILHNPAIGPDSYTGYLVSTMMGSTETTFYVLAVYFGAVQIRYIRHALAAGLLADFAGMMASVFAVKIFLFS